MMGDVPHPTTVLEYSFVVTEFLVAVLVFATIIGNVGNIISSMNAERDKFQETMDGVKRYMVIRRVNKDLERRVIRSAAVTVALVMCNNVYRFICSSCRTVNHGVKGWHRPTQEHYSTDLLE